MKKTQLPPWATKRLASCPRAGGGVHRWLFGTALKLHPLVPDEDQLITLISDATSDCGRNVSEQEIADAVYSSALTLGKEANGQHPVRRWPLRNEGALRSVLTAGPTLKDLEAASPVRWHDGAQHTEEIVDRLFPGNPLICAGPRKEMALTRTREEWRGFLAKQQFIVPSPMSETHGLTKSGERSMRTLTNTGPRRFLVVEFDQGDFDQHAAILSYLRKHAPLALVVHSGNKSLHGWFYCAGQPDEKVERFFGVAISLGADAALWNRCQWVRIPDGQRDNGRPQRAVFFNPEVVAI